MYADECWILEVSSYVLMITPLARDMHIINPSIPSPTVRN
jgi:hypothetical protein